MQLVCSSDMVERELNATGKMWLVPLIESYHLQPFPVQLCATKCRLQLRMVAYVTILKIWMDFDLPFN